MLADKFQSRTRPCYSQPAVPGGSPASMPLFCLKNGGKKKRRKKESRKKNTSQQETGTGNRLGGQLLTPGAEFGWPPLLLSSLLARAGRRVAAAGSRGLFIAKLLYQTPGSSLFSCCRSVVGCHNKLVRRRCGELPGGSLPDYCSQEKVK